MVSLLLGNHITEVDLTGVTAFEVRRPHFSFFSKKRWWSLVAVFPDRKLVVLTYPTRGEAHLRRRQIEHVVLGQKVDAMVHPRTKSITRRDAPYGFV